MKIQGWNRIPLWHKWICVYGYIIMEKLSLILEKGSVVEEITLYQKVEILFNIFKVIVYHVLWFCFVYFSLRQVTCVTSSLPFRNIHSERAITKEKHECKTKIRYRCSGFLIMHQGSVTAFQIWLSRTQHSN